MFVSCLSSYPRLSNSYKSKGHITRYLGFSAAIFVTTSLALGLGAWSAFYNLFRAGPDPKSYIDALRVNMADDHLQRLVFVNGVSGSITVILTDVLLAST
jgi:hypothetical protein